MSCDFHVSAYALAGCRTSTSSASVGRSCMRVEGGYRLGCLLNSYIHVGITGFR